MVAVRGGPPAAGPPRAGGVYGFFMADTIGYEHGTKQSYWVIVFMALVPFAFYSADWFAGYIWQAKGGK